MNGIIYLMKLKELYHISNLFYFIERSFHKDFTAIHQVSFKIKRANSIFKRKNHYHSVYRAHI